MAAVGPRDSRNFRNLATTQADEDAYDYVKHRVNVKFTGLIGSIAHVVKGALGGGILSGHVGYMKAGWVMAVPLNVAFGIYMGYCLHLLVLSAQILYKRTKIPSMSYSDVGEAAAMTFPNSKIKMLAKPFRYTIDAIICLDLFGSCACYQIIIAKQLKQLVENNHSTSFEGQPGFPSLRVYLAIMIPFVVIICLIRHLKYLAPFSVVANIVILFCIVLAIYYAFYMNPSFEGMKPATSAYHAFEFIGMSVFSMSCAGVVLPIENNMREPKKFPFVLAVGMSLIIVCTFFVSFFGYVAFLDECESPITINFPMNIWPKLLKAAIAMMIYVTHALNFWVPFNLCFYYLKKKHPPNKEVFWELVYRVIFVVLIGITAIVFPDINAIMGFVSGSSIQMFRLRSHFYIDITLDTFYYKFQNFAYKIICFPTNKGPGLGTFCLSNMAFIWPNVINLLVIWDRPGLGHMKWRLWRGMIFILIGVFVFICGSMVTLNELVTVFINLNVKALMPVD